MRIGHGYDVHRLVEGRDLILGGVKIDYEKGLLGHSDADVLLHAVSDALLGAAGLGDIGRHFPDTDPQYKGADSLMLLREVYRKIAEKGYRVGNIDVTMIAQKPKLKEHIPQMTQNIAEREFHLIAVAELHRTSLNTFKYIIRLIRCVCLHLTAADKGILDQVLHLPGFHLQLILISRRLVHTSAAGWKLPAHR